MDTLIDDEPGSADLEDDALEEFYMPSERYI